MRTRREFLVTAGWLGLGIPETFFIDRTGRITYKHIGALDARLIASKLDETIRGVASAAEGRGEYQSSR